MKFHNFLLGFFLILPTYAELDSDDDGLSDFDENILYLTRPDLKDSDGDGHTDAQEIVAGTDPNDISSAFIINEVSAQDDVIEISFTSLSNRHYSLHQSSNLPSGVWNIEMTNVLVMDTHFTMTNTSSNTTLFYKISTEFNADPPSITNSRYEVVKGQALNVPAPGVMINNGESNTVHLYSQASNGVVTLNADGSFIYSSNAGFSGVDYFTYKIFDGVLAGNIATATVFVLSNTNIQLESWTYDQATPASLVAASQVAGMYATANRFSDTIEIRDIRQTLLASIQPGDIPLDISGEAYGPCSLAFTPCGRQLFIGVCTDGEDAVLVYYVNTRDLGVFDRLEIDSNMADSLNYGMTYFKGELFVGTENGMHRYIATRNIVSNSPAETVLNGSCITGIAVDMIDEKLYLTSPTSLYRAVLPTLTVIASGTDFEALTFGRTYGSPSTSGLFILSSNSLKRVPIAELRTGGTITLQDYSNAGDYFADISATACGRMMLAAASPQMLSDISDTRLTFDAWVQDEFNQYMYALKSLMWQDGILPEGFHSRKLMKAGDGLSSLVDMDTSGWATYCLLAGKLINNDPEIEDFIQKIFQRMAGDHPDGKGGVKTVDGVLYDTYNSSGDVTTSDGTIYTMMKLLPAAYKAAEMFPDNNDIAGYKKYFRSIMKRSSDTINSNYKITWRMDDHGPLDINNGTKNETWIYAHLAGAQDPFASEDYEAYLWDRNDIDQWDNWLTGEPVLKASHSAFIYLGATMILQRHRDGINWMQQHTNYYAISMAAGDEMGSPYFTAFSAGSKPGGGYHADGPSDHPGDVIHFPAVCGFGQFWISPVVGAYLAYRDGLRQELQGSTSYPNPQLLTRWSMADSSYVMPSIGLADFWFGLIGLAEVLKPGTLDYLADEFYLPEPNYSLTNGQVRIDYSKITPRRILGSNDGTNFVSYGFQYTPFLFDAGTTYVNYYVMDPEGTLLAIQNSDFENDLNNWISVGDYEFALTDEVGKHIVDKSAVIRAVPASGLIDSYLLQTLDVSTDPQGTRYIIRADGYAATPNPLGKSFVRIAWDDDANSFNGGIVSIEKSNILDTDNERVEFLLNTQKPLSNSDFLHLTLVAEMGSPATDEYIFDNVSMVRLGKDEPISNGDFESGNFTDWSGESALEMVNDPSEVLEGSYSTRFKMPLSIVPTRELRRNFDVSGDPDGTRYIFRLLARADMSDDSDFEILAKFYDVNGARIITRSNLKNILPLTDREVVFTLRKRPEYDSLRLYFRMTRDTFSSGQEESVIIDDFRLDKEILF